MNIDTFYKKTFAVLFAFPIPLEFVQILRNSDCLLAGVYLITLTNNVQLSIILNFLSFRSANICSKTFF